MTRATCRRITHRGGERVRRWSLLCALLGVSCAHAQQFNSDNQWTAPHGVATFVATIGEEYSAFYAVAALLPRTEFNLGVTRYAAVPGVRTEEHSSGTFYVKRTMYQNEAENGGWSITAGTGLNPSYLNRGEVTDTFRSWFTYAAITFPFRDGDITWDVLPGVSVNLNKNRSHETAWNATYSSRVAVYKIIPQSAIVAEAFGTAGEAHSEPQYRAGIRWESPRLIVALTYGEAFKGDDGARFELGFMMLTNPVQALCWGHERC